MIQLEILSDETARVPWVARQFPVRIGRSANSDLQLAASGVWDRHLELNFDPARGFVLAVQPDAIATVNGESVRETVLHNGDSIEIGSVKLRFWLGATRQTGLRLREALPWAALLAITAGQIALIYWLLP